MSNKNVSNVRKVEMKVYDRPTGKILEDCHFDIDLKTIRSIKGFMKGVWSNEYINDAISGLNSFSDVDAHVERYGRSLFLEFKQSTESMNRGQVLKAIRQAKYQKTCTWFVFGETNNASQILKIDETGVEGEFKSSELLDIDMEELRKMISEWELFARRRKLINSPEFHEVYDVMEKVGIHFG